MKFQYIIKIEVNTIIMFNTIFIEFGDTYFQKLGEKIQLQHPEIHINEGKEIENLRNSYSTPKSTIFWNTFENALDAKPIIQMIHSREIRKLSASQVSIYENFNKNTKYMLFLNCLTFIMNIYIYYIIFSTWFLFSILAIYKFR